MSDVKLVAVFAENKPGQVAHFTGILARANLSLCWVNVTSTGPFGVMKFLVNDPELACQALKHDGFVARTVDALAVEVSDQPGALHRVADCLAQQQINLENASGFIVGPRAILVIETQDTPRAATVLAKAGLRVLSRRDLPAF
ncbi:MAG: ACT domain-containing protein [Verrucomicrobiota bacterium]